MTYSGEWGRGEWGLFEWASPGSSSPTPPTPTPVPLPELSPVTANDFTYWAFDLLSGALLGTVPFSAVQFGSQLNTPGQFTGTINLYDSRVQSANVIACTIPNRTLIVVDYLGAIVWAGIVRPRIWSVNRSSSATSGTLAITATEIWSYFTQRVQATDYSAPPSSGIVDPMAWWTTTPWDASLITCQIIGDAIGYSQSQSIVNGNLLGGMALLLNGSSPGAWASVPPSAAYNLSQGNAADSDYVAVTYPFTTVQTVDTIVQQLSQLGLYVGPDFGVDVAWSGASGSPPVATINVSYPRRGRTVAQSQLWLDLQTSLGQPGYTFPEDGTSTGNQVYEVGGTGAIVVGVNPFPLDQGYPLWERVLSRATMQSQNIIGILSQVSASDLALYSYAPVAPTVTLAVNDPNLPLGSFTVGDDVELFMPQYAGVDVNGDPVPFDPRFPAGLQQEWRLTTWQVTAPDKGVATMLLTLSQPPTLQPIAPVI